MHYVVSISHIIRFTYLKTREQRQVDCWDNLQAEKADRPQAKCSEIWESDIAEVCEHVLHFPVRTLAKAKCEMLLDYA